MQKLSRRHVVASLGGTGLTLMCPAFLNAAVNVDWDGIPTDTPVGQAQTLDLPAGPGSVEISALAPGEVAVIARPTDDPEYSRTGQIQYIAVHHRTDEQVAFGEANDRTGTVSDPRYFVVNLVCTHRGKAIGLTGDPSAPFACTDRGGRHSSDYDASGFGVAGASEGEYLSIPGHSLDVSGGTVTLTLT